MGETTYMHRALDLAALATGSVSPRPAVGAVVVSPSGDVVGEGFTEPSPGPHAEVVALTRAAGRARGATVYVTLEPCCHTGSTPPCTEALIAAGVKRVVVGCRDPYPDVNGRGIKALRDAGVEVRTGVLRDRANATIEPFSHWIDTGRPFVTLKLAATLDGKVAAGDGTSRWITGTAAREEVHELRRCADAVVVGAGTIAVDDPSLTCRLPGFDGMQPRRVVVDSSGRTSPGARVFDDAAQTLVVTTHDVPESRLAQWRRAGALVCVVGTDEGGVDLHAAFAELGRLGMCHALVEGGPSIAGSLVSRGLVDRCRLYLAPRIIGGDAPSLVRDGVKTLTDAWRFAIEDVRRVGDDIRIDARPARGEA